MFRALVAAILFAASTLASAQFSGSVGVETNYIFRGDTYSNKQPSAFAEAGVRLPVVAGVSAFGNVNVHTINVPGTELRAQARGQAGLGYSLGPITVDAGLTQFLNYGGTTGVTQARGYNSREVFVRATADTIKGGKAFAQADLVVSNDNFSSGHDAFYTVGYVQPINEKLKVGADLIARRYDTAGVTKFNNADVFVAYSLTKNVDIVGTQSFGGKRANGADLPNLTSVGISYKF